MRNPYYLAKLAISLARLTMDLDRLDKVFELNDILLKLRSVEDADHVLEEFRNNPVAAEALRSRHRLGRLDRAALAAMPETTLGGCYGRFMVQRGLQPENLPDLRPQTDVEYVLAHFYETHDLWHVITGFDTDYAGEAGIQAFYLAQFRSYMPFLLLSAILLNTAAFAYEDKERRLDAICRGWQLGKRAKCLVGIDWRPQLGRPIADVRRELGLSPA